MLNSKLLDLLPSKLESSSFNTDTVIAITVFFSVLCGCFVIGHLLEENRWANESIIALVLGLISGAVVLLWSKGGSSKILVFSEELFFIYLLPPIIFNAGFQVKKKQFFKNFSVILLFGILGTIISFCLISLGSFLLFKWIGVTQLDVQDYLAIGAILSATDSVCTLQILNQDETPFLYSIVFGEGVVNDATSIVLFNAVQSIDFSNVNGMTALSLSGTFLYLFFTSTLLGILVGLLSAYIIKTLYIGRHSTDREIAIMIIMAYLSYMIAELMSLSGILTVFFCGIVMSHYTWHNITHSSRTTTKHTFATMSFIAEAFIFLYVGMDALDLDQWKASNAGAGTSLAVSSSFLALVLIGRAAFVFPLVNIANYFNNNEGTRVNYREQFVIWWAGLMRGAVTVALAYNQFTDSEESNLKEHSLMITSTILVVLFSTLVFGTLTKPLIRTLFADNRRPDSEDNMMIYVEVNGQHNEGSNEINNIYNRGSSSENLPIRSVHYLWRQFDLKFMRPIFGGAQTTRPPPAESPNQNQVHDENHGLDFIS